MNNILQDLNDNQKQAVLICDRPLRIIAGAGSGKTKVITSKIAYLINQFLIPSHQILAVTFTNKAANEMKTRVQKILNDNDARLSIFTFHGLCARILREDYLAANLQQKFSIIDQSDIKTIIRKIIVDLNLDFDISNKKLEGIVVSKISSWKNELSTPSELMDYATTIEEQNYIKIYQQYLEFCRREEYVDFDDLQIHVYNIFKNNSEVLAKWQRRFAYILVDEFQDTNELQYSLIKFLLGSKETITVVGDPDQTIYTWRGAKVDLILNFPKVFANSTTVLLTQNYRSTQPILNIANDFIAKNINREKKDIFTDKVAGMQTILREATSRYNEAKYVANQIAKLTKEGYKYSDIFILYRINAWSQEFEKVFNNANIPYQLIGSIKFRDRKVVKETLAWIKALIIRDEISIERAFKTVKKIGAVTIEKLLLAAKEANMDLITFLITQNEETINRITKLLDIALFKKLISQVEQMVASDSGIEELARFINVTSGYQSRVEELNIEDSSDLEILNALYDQMANFDNEFQNHEAETTRIMSFLHEEALDGTNENTDDVDKVTLLTIHAAKGLENKVVFVCGINKDVFPSRRSLFSASALEEERRALYVALTRAEERLYITYVKGELSYITNGELGPSRFIKELNQDHYELDNFIPSENKGITPIKSSFNNGFLSANQTIPSTTDLKIGDVVTHAFFGDGIVIDIKNNQIWITYAKQYGTLKSPFGNKSLKKK